MCIEPPKPRDRLSLEHVTSPPRKKYRTTFKSLVVDSKEDEECTYSNEIGGGGGEKFNTTTTQHNIEEELEPNLDKVIDNIQIEPFVSIEPIVSIVEPTQLVVVTTKSSQLVQPIIEPNANGKPTVFKIPTCPNF
jgi:hypothetical protein